MRTTRAASGQFTAFLDGLTPRDVQYLRRLASAAQAMAPDSPYSRTIITLVSALTGELSEHWQHGSTNPRFVTRAWDRFLFSLGETIEYADSDFAMKRGTHLDHIRDMAVNSGKSLNSLVILRLHSAVHAEYAIRDAYETAVIADLNAEFANDGVLGAVSTSIQPGRGVTAR